MLVVDGIMPRSICWPCRAERCEELEVHLLGLIRMVRAYLMGESSLGHMLGCPAIMDYADACMG
jgi:hypothetical protein